MVLDANNSSFSIEVTSGPSSIMVRGELSSKEAFLRQAGEAFDMVIKNSPQRSSNLPLPGKCYLAASVVSACNGVGRSAPILSKIHAIKRVREIVPCGLKEAKDFVEGGSLVLNEVQIERLYEYFNKELNSPAIFR